MVDIGGLIARLAPLIEKRVREEYSLLTNTKTEAEELSSNLKEIQKVLEEAERRRLTDPRVRTWLERLQDVTYEIDDALDDWETANLELQIQESEDDGDDFSRTWWKKVSIFIQSLSSCFNHVCKRRDIALNMRKLNEKVDLFAKETAKYTLLPISGDSQDVKRQITTAFSELFETEGQKKVKNWLLGKLLRSDQESDDIQVISLVGMVGVGKTAVAQLAFHDDRVKKSFERRSWIYVSQVFDEIRITKAILQSLGMGYPEEAELQTLLDLIVSSISATKFLLVLDHVWIQDDSIWKQLKASLRYGAPGSRILVTTRNENVSKLMGSSRVRTVDPLSFLECRLLFRGMAFRGREKKEIEKLESIGVGIAAKCEGMLHAAKTLADYLQSRFSKELWEDVLEKEVWELEDVAKALFAPLAFDFYTLPLAVKHCFLCCAIFPKDVDIIHVDELIRVWMVQGYLFSSGTDKEMELKGQEYFEILAARSFFQDVRKDEYGERFESCRMHPILHDFARYLTKTGSKVKELRSFYSENQLTPDQLGSLKSVRVLIQRRSEMQELPPEVGKLIHLRYLDLGSTPIKKLPTTICNLYNLQSLDLRYCKHLSELPEEIRRLRNLKHLLNRRTPHLKRLPHGVGKLTTLRKLDEFKVGEGMSEFGYLADLNLLQGSMHIFIGGLNEEEEVVEAEKAQLSRKIHLSDLALSFSGEVRIEVMEALQAPPNLKRLRIERYRGTRFPGWVNSLDKLNTLFLKDCEKCLDLPPLGTLPSLEYLHIRHMKSLEHVDPGFLGFVRNDSSAAASIRFPKLRVLVFVKCGSWREWTDISDEEEHRPSIMPCLDVLVIQECPKLVGLPHFLLQRRESLGTFDVSEHLLLK